MAPLRVEVAASRTASSVRGRLAEDLRRLCGDAGVSQDALSRAADVPQGFISRILAGNARPSIETYAKLASAIGADLSARLYPNTGPTIRDRHQARILEGLLRQLHPRWQVFTEVAVRNPARGWIDAALHEDRERKLVATEVQSDLRRLEQLLRWSREKADALPSWAGWSRLGEEPDVSMLLVVRRTRATQQLAREFGRQLRVAYPAHPDDAVSALTGVVPWPGSALVWARIDADRVRLLSGR
ncbi:MAG: helix-turn-helix transcriptional regulator [Chloroflexi bacterium]|nr:helix-turn-helix transcriptional regulator [Chloroflexota bacterium]